MAWHREEQNDVTSTQLRVSPPLALLVLVFNTQARADVGPPVEIKMSVGSRQAVSNQEYAGAFEVRVFKAGTLADFELYGAGWNMKSVDLPGTPLAARPSVVRIAFTAIPADADRPIGLSLTWNGRRVRQAYEIGPSYFARAGKPYLSARVPGTNATVGEEMRRRPTPVGETSPSVFDGARDQYHFVGRIVYSRPGRDLSNPPDGDFDDPEDIPPTLVGADTIDVRVLDEDDLDTEEMWSWYTDENGYFDTGAFSWDDGGDVPDLILYYETEVTGVVDVTDNSDGEWTYTFVTDEIEDFEGSYHDFGNQSPADNSLHPALHIFNNVVRTRRYIEETPAYLMPEVQVEWPDNSEGDNAWYEYWTDEIHLSTSRQWRNDTISHEYGHHFIYSTYDPDPPEVAYCNEICDPDYPDVCSHCMWCQETDHDAWNEGFPNWLADIVTRDHPDRYTHEPSGVPFVPLYTRSQESLGTCDGVAADVLLTEGYIGALLRDMEDQTQDNHDDDAIFDMMCLGPNDIFHVVVQYQPITVRGFIGAFLAARPEHTGDFWPTAFNVGGAPYVSGFPADTQPPGAVLACSSPTHPPGEGGSRPCITFEWWLAQDDASGASEYSFLVTTDPAGEEPDEVAETVWGTDTCSVTGEAPAWDLGEFYFSIKARDNAGNWASEWSTFGPFEVIDCNDTGVLDICDVSCNAFGTGSCQSPPDRCVGEPGCGSSSDCQPNWIPDECDIANGTSEDCNLDGRPDECENMFHWAGESGSWHSGLNWLEGIEPEEFPSVCIDVPGDQTVYYTEGESYLISLACRENLHIDGETSPPPDVTIVLPSWVEGDLRLSGQNHVLQVNERLDIAGQFNWTGDGELTGPGTTYANGGTSTSGLVYLDDHHLILDGNSASVGTGRIEFPGASTFEIRPGSSYEHQGGHYFLNGGSSGDYFTNAGTLIKSVNPGDSQIRAYTQNDGLIHVQTGKLTCYYGGSSSGAFLGDPGTTLEFRGGHAFLADSSVVGDSVRFPHGGHTVYGTYNVTTSTTCDAYVVNFTEEANIISYGPTFHVQDGTVNFDAIIGGPVHFDTLDIRPTDGIANFNSGDPVEITDLIIGRGMIQSVGDITITGSLTWNAGGDFAGPGTVHANCDVLVNPNGDQKTLSSCTFNNAATATFLGGINRSSSVFNNLATGVMDIRADVGVFNNAFSDPFNNAGTVIKSAGTGRATFRAVTTNTGTIDIQSGKLSFTGSYGGGFIQTAGQTVLNGGNLEITGNASLQFNGGLLTGDGTITGRVHHAAGTVAPGLPVGHLAIAGTYTQQAGAVLDIELSGTATGEFDTMSCAGNVSLDGDLAVTFVVPFEPVQGDTFVVLESTDTLAGTFDNVSVTNLPTHMILDVDSSGDAVTLTVIGGDCDSNGGLDLDDFSWWAGCMQGPNNDAGAGCDCADLDNDGDVDLLDFGAFQMWYGE